jgi:gamma-polyglutamate synthase
MIDPSLPATLLALGAVSGPAVAARIRHRRRLRSIPVRVNVNGHRGKTTVTRLMTGALAASGQVVAGKTTGTVPRVMLAPDWCEWAVRRRPDSPNIAEQFSATRFAEALGARAMVAECMAVNPEYQRVFADELTEANIGVLCNVLRDHLDVMGPTVKDAAAHMAVTVPRRGVCVTIPGRHVPVLEQFARARGSRLVITDPSSVDPVQLRRFSYLVLPEHVALVTAAAEAAGVPADLAWGGMLAAEPDPYATRIVDVGEAKFVSGFSINDPDSTLRLWRTLTASGHRGDDVTLVMAARADRRDRTLQFVHLVLPRIEAAEIVVIGDGGDPIITAHRAGRLPAGKITDLCGAGVDEVIDAVAACARTRPGSTLYGIGNVKGVAMDLSDRLGATAGGSPAGTWPDDRTAVAEAGRLRSAAAPGMAPGVMPTPRKVRIRPLQGLR